MVSAVNAGGDADSLGCIAGAVAGAFHGLAGIPARWSGGVRGVERLLDAADGVFLRWFELAGAGR